MSNACNAIPRACDLEPSPFFRQHVALDAPEIDARSFRPYWRVRTRLDQLLIDHAISYAQWYAGVTFRLWVERRLGASYGGQSLDRSDRPSAGFDASAVRGIDASDELDRVCVDLGADHLRLVSLFVVHDVNFRDIARALDCHPTTARKRTIDALRALTLAMCGHKKTPD